jgi:hypothetical protein
MGPRCSSAETQVCHRSYIIAANLSVVLYPSNFRLSDGSRILVNCFMHMRVISTHRRVVVVVFGLKTQFFSFHFHH